MPSILPDHLSSCSLKEDAFELAHANSESSDRSLIKYCLAVLHRLYPEEPSTHAYTKKYPEAGLQIEQIQTPVAWVIIHCPPKTHPTHLAATVMITRLASIKDCLVVFDSPPKADLLVALEMCGQLAEQTFCLDDAQGYELMQHMNQRKQGRLVLLGETPDTLSKAALKQATPILYATRVENIIANPLERHFSDYFNEHLFAEEDEQCIRFDPNLTPALFMEHTLLVAQIPEEKL